MRQILQAWEYGDPALVVERRESEQLAREAAAVSRETAAREIEATRFAGRQDLSPATARLLKRLRIRELVRRELGKRGG